MWGKERVLCVLIWFPLWRVLFFGWGEEHRRWSWLLAKMGELLNSNQHPLFVLERSTKTCMYVYIDERMYLYNWYIDDENRLHDTLDLLKTLLHQVSPIFRWTDISLAILFEEVLVTLRLHLVILIWCMRSIHFFNYFCFYVTFEYNL